MVETRHMVSVIPYNAQGKALLQQRDYNPGIKYPGHWTIFGGAVEPEDESYEVAARRELHRKLVWGTDYPIPVLLWPYWRRLKAERKRIASIDSWIDRDLGLKRALGFDECVFKQAARLLRVER